MCHKVVVYRARVYKTSLSSENTVQCTLIDTHTLHTFVVGNGRSLFCSVPLSHRAQLCVFTGGRSPSNVKMKRHFRGSNGKKNFYIQFTKKSCLKRLIQILFPRFPNRRRFNRRISICFCSYGDWLLLIVCRSLHSVLRRQTGSCCGPAPALQLRVTHFFLLQQ